MEHSPEGGVPQSSCPEPGLINAAALSAGCTEKQFSDTKKCE